MKALALDMGGSGGKMFLGTFNGGKIHIVEMHRFKAGPGQVTGHLVWDMAHIYYAVGEGFQKSANEKFISFGVDSFSNDYSLLDKNGLDLTWTYTYRDNRTIGVLEKMDQYIHPLELYSRTGCQRARFNTLPQLVAHLDSDEGDLFEEADALLFVPDLINFHVCGEKSTEFTIASVSQLYNRVSSRWDDQIFNLFNIPKRIFPEVKDQCDIIGSAKSEFLRQTGCSDFTVCTVGHHDTASAVAAVPTDDKDLIYISSGTWCLMGTETDHMITTETAFRYNFANEGGVGGRNRFLKNIMGLWLIQEVQRELSKNGNAITFEEMDEAAEKCPPFRSIINPDDPQYFEPGGMTEKIQKRCKETNQQIPETPGEINRCVKESLALAYRRTLGQIEEMTGMLYPVIHIIGGGAKSELLNQMAASATGRPVLAGPIEAAAIGNLCAQFMSKGEIKGWNEARKIVKNSFPVKEYLPVKDLGWDDAYERYLSQISD